MALEDSMEEERKQLQGRLESFESIVRMFEIKLKNSQDQGIMHLGRQAGRVA